jgi:hypothetical protein
VSTLTWRRSRRPSTALRLRLAGGHASSWPKWGKTATTGAQGRRALRRVWLTGVAAAWTPPTLCPGPPPRRVCSTRARLNRHRGARVMASGLADLGFDVDVSPLFQTPQEVRFGSGSAQVWPHGRMSTRRAADMCNGAEQALARCFPTRCAALHRRLALHLSRWCSRPWMQMCMSSASPPRQQGTGARWCVCLPLGRRRVLVPALRACTWQCPCNARSLATRAAACCRAAGAAGRWCRS